MDSPGPPTAAASPRKRRRTDGAGGSLSPSSAAPEARPDAGRAKESSSWPASGSDCNAGQAPWASPESRSRSGSGVPGPPLGASDAHAGSAASSTGSGTPRRRPSATASRSGSPGRRSRSSCSPNRTPSSSATPAHSERQREAIRPNYRPRLILHGHSKPVSQVRISPDGRYIASASADATVKIWDAATGAHMDTLVGHMAGVSCLAWAPDSKTLATGSDDKVIRLWDRVTGRPKTAVRKSKAGQWTVVLRGHHNYIHCLAFSPKGNMIVSGSYDEAVFLWDVRAGRLMRSLPAHSDPVSGIDFSPDGTLVVSCSTDGLIRVWDTYTGQCLRTLVHEDNPAVANVCFSPNGRFVLASSLDNCIRLWDYVAGTVKKTYQGHRNEKFAIGGCFAVLDGQPLVVSASEEGDVVLWDVKSKALLQRVSGHEGVCFWVDVDGTTMVSAGQDNTVRVYRHARPNSEAGNGECGLKGKLPLRSEDGGTKEEVAAAAS